MLIRLDKYLCQTTGLSRSQAKKAIVSGQVFINLKCVKEARFKVKEQDSVIYSGKSLVAQGKCYIMLHKPKGYICSTQDEIHPSVLNLIDRKQHHPLHIAGRLDVDTTGLVLITDDGQWSHQVTSPKKNCQKQYQVDVENEIRAEVAELFSKGILLKNETRATLPAQLLLQEKNRALLTIQEGRYHQVKRMFTATGNHVTALHRISIGAITLDQQLNEGQWRYLTTEEVSSV